MYSSVQFTVPLCMLKVLLSHPGIEMGSRNTVISLSARCCDGGAGPKEELQYACVQGSLAPEEHGL